jgi:hypothetical protein
MNAAMRVAAILLILIGLIWTGQGFGWIKGSFMTGSMFWAIVGLICLVAGAALAYQGFVRPGRPRA